MASLLDYLPRIERVELDSACDVGDTGLAGLSGGGSRRPSWFPGTGPAGPVADAKAGDEDAGTRRARDPVGQRKAATVSVAAARARGKLILAGGTPAAFTAMPMIRQMAW